MEYAKTVRNVKSDSRKRAMPDNFGKPKTEMPSNGIVNAGLSTRDDKADETRAIRNEEKDLRHDGEKDVVDTKAFKAPDNQNQAPPPIRTTTNEPAAVPELKSAFAKCWTTVDEFDIPAVTYFSKSSYTPFGFNLFQILFAMESALNGNEELRWKSPMYFSLPVRVYYAVIFYVQILRAKESSGTLTKPDSSFLRAFLRRFKDTDCPIAGPLVPFFTNLTACLPDDKQYDTVTPTLPSKGTYSVTHEGQGSDVRRILVVDPLHHVLPSVPLVGSLLRTFANNANIDHLFNVFREFIPVPETGGDFAGITFPAQTNGTWTGAYAQVINNPAMMRPLPESEFRLREVHQHWRRSGVRFFPDITTNVPFTPEGPSGHTQLIDNYDWFEMCRDMASIQVQFFADSTNLSQIPVLGGRSTLVVAELSVRDPNNDAEIGRPNSVDDWYPDTFRSLKSTFYSLTPILHQDDKYNAIYSLTNATLNWKTPSDHKIGSDGATHRSGPYWSNTKRTFELSYARSVSTGLYNMVQQQFYTSRP
jgi:hypothetical protein